MVHHLIWRGEKKDNFYFFLNLVNCLNFINKELNTALETFNASGGGAVLMDVNNGDVISLVSLPNFNINKRSKNKYRKK